jgi:hypothetical protein
MFHIPGVVGLLYVLIEDSNGCSSPGNSFVATETKTAKTNNSTFDIRPSTNKAGSKFIFSLRI